MEDPPGSVDESVLARIQGSMMGMALRDALGARVEFKPPEYLLVHPVTDLQGGGTWGLKRGQVRIHLNYLEGVDSFLTISWFATNGGTRMVTCHPRGNAAISVL